MALRKIRFFVFALFMSATCAAQGQQPSAKREPTDLMIRRLAGLPADSANGQIEIIDVGHHALDTMFSIVGNKTDAGWSVSYACAMSPFCSSAADHDAKAYVLSPEVGAEIDQILATLKSGAEPDGTLDTGDCVCGHLLVSINYNGFKRDYRRAFYWGKTLARLEALMEPPASNAARK